MDQRLLTWARAVKRRRRVQVPVLWLFTDEARQLHPLPVIAALPPGLCGVVLRHDSAPNRAKLAADVAKLCRARRLALVIAGDARLAGRHRAGLHLRGGRLPGLARRRPGCLTSSAHGIPEIRRARRAGAKILFISPAFATGSHPGQPGLGALRWSRLSHHTGTASAFALGGIDGRTIKSLAKFCCGAGAIHALQTGI